MDVIEKDPKFYRFIAKPVVRAFRLPSYNSILT